MSLLRLQPRMPHVSKHVSRNFSSGLWRRLVTPLLLALVTAAAPSHQVFGQNTPDSQKLPWQIESSSLSGKQNSPVIFLAPAQTTILANKSTVVDLHFRIADGLHINSHKPHDATLIPTQVLVADIAGLNTTAIDFPSGSDAALPFVLDQKLNVYTGELVLHAHITAQAGDHVWHGVIRYQACDNSQCLPPRKLPVAVDIIAK